MDISSGPYLLIIALNSAKINVHNLLSKHKLPRYTIINTKVLDT